VRAKQSTAATNSPSCIHGALLRVQALGFDLICRCEAVNPVSPSSRVAVRCRRRRRPSSTRTTASQPTTTSTAATWCGSNLSSLTRDSGGCCGAIVARAKQAKFRRSVSEAGRLRCAPFRAKYLFSQAICSSEFVERAAWEKGNYTLLRVIKDFCASCCCCCCRASYQFAPQC